MSELAEYWRDVQPVLKEQNQKERTEHYNERIKFAINLFEKNEIKYKLCNEENGHFNLYKDNKVVMSFWSWTGKCYIPSTGYSDNIGIRNCVKKYKKIFGSD